MDDQWRSTLTARVEEYLGWAFDEDSLAQWRIRSDALADTLLEHPSFQTDNTVYDDLLNVIEALEARGVIDSDVTEHARELDEASQVSEYGCYSEEGLRKANIAREALYEQLCAFATDGEEPS